MIISVSEDLIQNTNKSPFRDYLLGLIGEKIILPDKFFPQKDLLAIRYEQYHRRNG